MTNLSWNEDALQRLIDDREEEHSVLEYKAAAALYKSDGKKKEIAKDVSAMANSAGGTIIYGISEYQEQSRQHFPEKIDPIDRTKFPKEWLEQVIAYNIHPRIEGLAIYPVDITETVNGVVYVVEIPQSTTAHQVTASKDYRYYRRYNFECVPMEDYEIRLVMNRKSTPDATLEIGYRDFSLDSERHIYALEARIKNQSHIVINHFKVELMLPSFIESPTYTAPQKEHITYTRDQRGNIMIAYRSKGPLFPQDQLDVGSDISWQYRIDNPTRYKLIETSYSGQDTSVKWTLYADNMTPKQGSKPFLELQHF